MKMSIVCIMFLLVSCWVSNETFAHHMASDDEAVLGKIDISPTSLILEIFNDIISECEESDKGRLFSLLLKDHESGEKVYIVQELDHRINQYKNILGYALIGNDTIIVYGKHLPDSHFSRDPTPLPFKIKDDMRSDFPEWQYFINNGIFARDGESMGWIWHIPSDKLNDYELTKYTITAPKRTRK